MSQRRLFIAAFLSPWASFRGHFSGTGPELGRRALSRGVSDASRRCKQCPLQVSKTKGVFESKKGDGPKEQVKRDWAFAYLSRFTNHRSGGLQDKLQTVWYEGFEILGI
jgi:hypothetical protein